MKMTIRIKECVDLFLILILVIFIIVSFCMRDSRLIAGRSTDGSFYYSDEFTGGVEDSLAFGIASVIFTPLTIFLLVQYTKREKNDLKKTDGLLLLFVTIMLQVLITHEWNDKSNFILNFLYGTIMVRVWFICFLVIILYFIYRIVNLFKIKKQ
jgi:hypothetical protein